MKSTIVSIILVLTFRNELYALLKQALLKLSSKQLGLVHRHIYDESHSDAVEEPQIQGITTPNELLSYERMRLGADLIINTSHGSGSKKVKLVSYVYDGNIVRRVVVKNRDRHAFGTFKITNIHNEAKDFKEAYLASLNPPQAVSKPETTPVVKPAPITIPSESKPKKLLAEYKGKVLSFGFTNYKDSDSQSFAVDILTDEGQTTLYGSGLERAIKDAFIEKGNLVTLLKYSPINVIDGNNGTRSSKAKIWVATKEA